MSRGFISCLAAILVGAFGCSVWAQGADSALRPWSVRLSAQVGPYRDDNNLLGQSRVSRAFVDPPPAPDNPARIRLTFSHGGSVDVRALSRAHTRWEFTIETDVPDADVTLRWEDVAKVPRGVNLRLVDLQTGRRLWMRTAPAFTFRTGSGVTRRQFAVEMDMDIQLPLRLSQVRVQQTRGGAVGIQFVLNKPASVRARVMSAQGKSLREIEPASSRQAGMHSLQWDGRDASGTALPAGAYLIELSAVTEELETVRTVVPVVLKR